MLDGRHTGTGGGNHFVLGGATPADSPFLRRPDLLASLIGYWHNHPSLSLPVLGHVRRPDEPGAAHRRGAQRLGLRDRDRLRASWRESPRSRPARRPPWLIDRLLRNLLIDVTGNTHRAEFCIDKLYSPDGPTGRLGLLEMRAFEMPPHARMSLVQQLLMRALVARFWADAVPAGAPRALGHRAARPLHAAALRLAGPRRRRRRAERRRLPVRARLVRGAPRVPLSAARRLHRRGRRRRAAHGARAVARARRGERRRRHRALRRLDGRADRGARRAAWSAIATCSPATAGACRCSRPARRASTSPRVRYRAWTAPSSLHPTIAVHVPLVFDLVDTWMNRSLGGCQYHVAHPGGINYTTFPINAYEAEARRLARFFRTGHTPGTLILPRRGAQPRLSAHPRSASAARAVVAFVVLTTMLDQLLAGYAAPEGRFDELLAAPGRPRAALGRVHARARRAQRARGERHALAHRAADPRARHHLQRLRRRRRACTGRGRSIRSRSSCRPTSGRRSPPASSSAPTCSTASSATSTARRRC